MHNPLSAVGTERTSRLAALAVCALAATIGLWLLVRLLWLLIPHASDATAPASVPSGNAPAGAATSIAQWHIFGNSQAVDLASRALNAPKTALKLTLRGTLALVDAKDGMAMIADEQNVERSYKVGDTIGASAKLAEVYADHVVLSHEGIAENLNLPLPQDRAVNSTSAVTGPRAGAAASSMPPGYTSGAAANGAPASANASANVIARSNAADLLRQVQFEPVFAGGKISGARLSGSGAAGALMMQVGLRPTDVVTSVNGTDLSTVSSPQQLLDKLGNASSLQVTVQRDGKPATLTLNLR